MSKADKTNAQNNITTTRDRANTQYGQGVADQSKIIQGLQPTTQGMSGNLYDQYSKFASTGGYNNPYASSSGSSTPTAGGGGGFGDKVNALYAKYGKSDTGKGSGITDASYWSNDALNNAGGDENYVLGRLESDLQGNGPDQGGGGSGGGGGSPSYVDTFNRLSSASGAFDPARSAAVSGAADSLYDTSGNYGDVNQAISSLLGAKNNYGATNTSIGGLQKFAATGGLNDEQTGRIFNPTLNEFAKTGGYSNEDLANIRARSNSGVASTYGNLQDELQRERGASGGFGPGWSEAGFKLARQGAQDIGTNAQNTEVGIKQAVNQNRLAAGTTLGQLGLGTAQLQSGNTLSGYGTSGSLDVSKNSAIQDAEAKAASAGLSRQAQIDAAKEAAAQIDLQRQGLINQTNLSAAGGLESADIANKQIDLGRYGINTNAGIQRTALANNATLAGLAGASNIYNTQNSNQENAQNRLLSYINGQTNANTALNGQNIQTGYMPGLADDIGKWLGVGASAVGGLSGGLSGFAKYLPKAAPVSSGVDAWGNM